LGGRRGENWHNCPQKNIKAQGGGLYLPTESGLAALGFAIPIIRAMKLVLLLYNFFIIKDLSFIV
jgi:hypothetical protein